MSKPGNEQHSPQGPAAERRKDALLLTGSVMFHIILFLLLPSLASPVQDSVELIVELLDARPVQRESGFAADGGGSSPVAGTADAVSDSPAAAGPAQNEQAEGAPDHPDTESQPADAGGGQPATPVAVQPAAPNEATAVVPPEPIVVQPVEPVEEKVAPPVEPPKVEPQEKPAPPTPKVTVDEAAPPSEAEQEEPQPPVLPEVNVDKSKPAGQGEAADPGTGGDQPGGQPSGSGDDSAGADDAGDGSSGDAAGPAGPPPGPSGAELDLLGEYGDKARQKIRRLARTPERAREQKLGGRVKFEFEVSKTGKLLSVKVIDSSGHPVLDEECLEATRVAAPFGRFPRDVTVGKWKFQMTLEFPL